MKTCNCGTTAALCEQCIIKKEAKEKLTDFFFWYTPEDAREELMHMMLELSVSDKKNPCTKAGSRLFFIHQLFKLIDASHKLRVVKFPPTCSN